MSIIGRNILIISKKKFGSIDAISGELGVTRQTLHKWGTGETAPSAKHIRAACEALGMTEQEIINYDVNKNLTSVPESRMIEVSEKNYDLAIEVMGSAYKIIEDQYKKMEARYLACQQELKKLKGE